MNCETKATGQFAVKDDEPGALVNRDDTTEEAGALPGTDPPVAECAWCGLDLELQGSEEPYRERVADEEEGDPICFQCWHDEYEFTCCKCCESGDVDHQHAFLVVIDAEEADLDKAGIYRVTGLPYYADGVVEGHLIKNSLTWEAPLPPGIDRDYGYPCGHLCEDCQVAFEGRRP